MADPISNLNRFSADVGAFRILHPGDGPLLFTDDAGDSAEAPAGEGTAEAPKTAERPPGVARRAKKVVIHYHED